MKIFGQLVRVIRAARKYRNERITNGLSKERDEYFKIYVAERSILMDMIGEIAFGGEAF